MPISKILERRAKENPNKIALYQNNSSMTYAELNNRANQLANYLKKRLRKEEQRVAFCLERSFDIFITMFAILKAGAVVVPLDSAYPKERINWILNNADIDIVLTQSHLIERFEEYHGEIVRFDLEQEQLRAHDETNLMIPINDNQLAYVIYTSGSTGRPKGVCVEHHSVINLINQLSNIVPVSPADNIIQFISTSFDGFILEWGLAFCGAASLILLPVKGDVLPIQALLNQVEKPLPITIALLPPTVAGLLSPNSLPNLKTLILGSEPCPSKVLDIWYGHVNLVNAYGPAEATVIATSFPCDRRFPSNTIGYPIKGVQLYIFDEFLREVKVGDVGELYLSGSCLARGYLNNPELTKARFISHPDNNAIRLYKTGDKVRQLQNGAIQYIGRVDDQIKINGNRIELQEIRLVLDSLEPVLSAYVTSYSGAYDRKQILAFYTLTKQAKKSKEFSNIERLVMQSLEKKLPTYMMPHKLICLEGFPMTINGKVDRDALLKMSVAAAIEKRTCPGMSDVEKILISICTDLTHQVSIKPEDSLSKLGFDSIMLLQLISLAKNKRVLLNSQTVFKKASIATIAKEATHDEKSPPSNDKKINHPLFLTNVQQSLVDLKLHNINYWNQATIIDINDLALDVSQLSKVIDSVCNRHVALRCTYKEQRGSLKPVLSSSHDKKVFFVYHLEEEVGQPKKIDINATLRKHHKTINLKTGPLIQFVLFYGGNYSPSKLAIIVHHFAIDGISWRILLSDIVASYYGNQWENTDLLYQKDDYYQWTKQLITGIDQNVYEHERNYWRQVTSSKAGLLPVERHAGQATYDSLSTMKFSLTSKETKHLLEGTYDHQIRVDALLLSALTRTLCDIHQQSSLYLMLTGHGRESMAIQADISNVIGWFTSLYPVRIKYNDALSLFDHVHTIQEQLATIPGHGFGYGVLTRGMRADDNSANLPKSILPNLLFNYSGQWQTKISENWVYNGLLREYCQDPKNQNLYSMEINVEIIDNQCHIFWSYSTLNYLDATIIRWGEAYQASIKMAIDCLLQPGKEIPKQVSL